MRLSLIIPTRERAATLEHCLRASLATDDQRLQVVVSDNCSQDNTREVVAKFSDARLIYVRTPQRVSMRQNFEFALTHATGDYIIYIGDDDAFLAFELPKLLALIEKLNADAIYWDPPTYLWPGVDTGKPTNRLVIRKDQFSGALNKIDTNEVAEDLKRCGPRYNDGPKLYHGCISRKFLDHVAKKTGYIFGGSIPDLYVQYYLSFSEGSVYSVGYPFTINGTSKASNGFLYHSSRDSGVVETDKQKFIVEAHADPVIDEIHGQLPNVVLYAFASLLSVVRDRNVPQDQVDFAAWYDHILRHGARLSEGAKAEVLYILQRHANSVGKGNLINLNQIKTLYANQSRQKTKSFKSKFRIMNSYVRRGKIIVDPSIIDEPTVCGAAHILRVIGHERNLQIEENVNPDWGRLRSNALKLILKSLALRRLR